MRDDSALKRFMDLRQGEAYPDGEGLYLVGMQVADLEAAVKRVEDAGGDGSPASRKRTTPPGCIRSRTATCSSSCSRSPRSDDRPTLRRAVVC